MMLRSRSIRPMSTMKCFVPSLMQSSRSGGGSQGAAGRWFPGKLDRYFAVGAREQPGRALLAICARRGRSHRSLPLRVSEADDASVCLHRLRIRFVREKA